MNRKMKTVPSIGWFVLFLVLGGLIAYIFWIFCIRNVLYHEWDPGFEPFYSFFGREPISLNGHGSWIATGWKEWHLDLIWATLTLSVYGVAGLFAWVRNKKSPYIKQYVKTVGVSTIVLVFVTMIMPRMNLSFFHPTDLLVKTGVQRFQEKNIPCEKPTFTEPRILSHYNAENGEVVMNLEGSNQLVAFEKDVQLRGRSAIFSPDETKVVALQSGWNEYWIMCTYSHGATKISIPEFEQNHQVAPRSYPSWSPDGQKLVVNLYGDVAIVDIATKKFEIVKKQVAFRDNHVDLTSKDLDRKIPAYEVGTVYWARDGLIYYSSFEGDKQLLHQYNLADQSDTVIYVTKEEISIKSGDPTGRYLLINISPINEDRSSGGFGHNIIFDVQNKKEVEQYDGNSIPTMVWSPSGKYFAQSELKKWSTKEGKIFIPASYVYTIDHSHDVNVSVLVEEYFSRQGKSIVKNSLDVQVVDFVDESILLAHVVFSNTVRDHKYALANVLVNFQTKEVKLLQDYPQGQATGKELFPLKVLHPVDNEVNY